jgi:hypothetical protein
MVLPITFACQRAPRRYSRLLAATLALLNILDAVKGLAASDFTLFDRFRPTCPADAGAVKAFDPSLQHDEEHTWVAVYRSCNNAPSVLVRDEFLSAMRSATNSLNPALSESVTLETTSSSSSVSTSMAPPGLVQQKNQDIPVAVARIRPSQEYPGTWVLDSMRCILKKETQDPSCDGGSEHLEAISTAVDALLEYHLSSATRDSSKRKNNDRRFSIRTKATLVSSKVLEDRGFVEVDRLEKDMATHISNLDACLERYAARSVTTDSKSQGARQRALRIVSLLGRMEQSEAAHDQNDNEKNGYDPFAGFNKLNR